MNLSELSLLQLMKLKAELDGLVFLKMIPVVVIISLLFLGLLFLMERKK